MSSDQKQRAANIQLAQQAMAAAQVLQQQASLTRKARRIHFSGLPIGIQAPLISDFVNGALKSAKLHIPDIEGEPVNEVNMGPDGRYAFVEFRSCLEAGNCLMLDGLNMMGATMRIQRPKDYAPVPNELLMAVIPKGIANATAASLISGFQRPGQHSGMHMSIHNKPTLTSPESELQNLMALTRRARRLHIGNLPIGVGLTSDMLKQYFNAMMISKGMNDTKIEGEPVVDCNIPNDKFGFIELRSAHETTAAMGLDGVELGDKALKVERPRDYQPVPDEMLRKAAVLQGHPPPPATGVGIPTKESLPNLAGGGAPAAQPTGSVPAPGSNDDPNCPF